MQNTHSSQLKGPKPEQPEQDQKSAATSSGTKLKVNTSEPTGIRGDDWMNRGRANPCTGDSRTVTWADALSPQGGAAESLTPHMWDGHRKTGKTQ